MKGKIVYCPICKRKTGKYSGLTDSLHISRCRRCNKRVVFVVETQETIIKDVPIRATSSGKTFY